jgi:rSAM/selenodomain-associated transferase 1
LLPKSVTHACALATMTKAPRAGEVKTRLVPPLTHSEAAALSVCLLQDTAANMAEVAARTAAHPVAVYAPAGSEKEFDGLLPVEFSLLSQSNGSLGDRLLNATRDLLRAGYESVCLINSDSPTLPPRRLDDAIALLARPGDRIVLGPADDGGYYLIGLKHAHHRVFEDVEWSTERVLGQTIERASEINIDVELLPPWYDLDDARTLARACQELLTSNENGGYPAPRTRDYLKRLLQAHGRERIWSAETISDPEWE